jgi:hypothetical protein
MVGFQVPSKVEVHDDDSRRRSIRTGSAIRFACAADAARRPGASAGTGSRWLRPNGAEKVHEAHRLPAGRTAARRKEARTSCRSAGSGFGRSTTSVDHGIRAYSEVLKL